MRSVNAWINGVSLRDLDGRIVVRSVTEETPQTQLTYGDNPGRDGQRLLGRVRQIRRVNVTFAVHELHDLPARSAAVDLANAWAQDGYMEVSYRPGRRLPVIVANRASVTDPRNYNEEFTISFDAPMPYWEDKVPRVLAISGTSVTGSITNLGTAPTVAEFSVKPSSAALGTLTVTVDGNSFSFTGLAIPGGVTLTCGYDEHGFLRIYGNGQSKLSCRTPASADELIVRPGVNSVSVTADNSVTGTLEVRSRWL